MEAIFLACGASGPQLKRNPLGSHTLMGHWPTRIIEATSIVVGLIMRFYGLFFVGVGGLFLFWAVRGFLAYANGIREAWADPTACVIGLLVGPLGLWAGFQMLRNPSRLLSSSSRADSELDRTIKEAMELGKSDPAASRQLLDSYFAREAAETEARRAELRRRAPQDISAALTLREELSKELRDSTAFRKDVLRKWPVEEHSAMLLELDAAEGKLQTELSEVAAIIDRLRLH